MLGVHGTYEEGVPCRVGEIGAVVKRVEQAKADHYSLPSDGRPPDRKRIVRDEAGTQKPEHPMSLVRKAYGI
jgi:hypothetical protein